MNRLMSAMSLAVVLAFTPFLAAGSSGSGGSSSSGGRQGQIQGVSTTNFSVGVRHRHGRLSAFMVHFNPDSASITLDGVSVRTLDASACGKYVNVVGTMKNGTLEATSITVTTAPPAHHHKKKSSSSV